MISRKVFSVVTILAPLLFFAFISAPPLAAQDSEALGRAAEQAGRLREAVNHYVAAFQSASEGSASDQALREKVISLVQKLSPPPAIPDEARRFAVRGQIAVREAKSQADYLEAAREFSKALKLAPWWAESYFNLAVAQEKAGQFTEAVRSLKLYLLAAPNAPDAEKIKDQIYALEYRQERARKEEQERVEETRRKEAVKREAEEQERRRQEQARREREERERRESMARDELARLAGRWRVDTYGGIFDIRITGGACEIRLVHLDGLLGGGSNWFRWTKCRYDPENKGFSYWDGMNEMEISGQVVSSDQIITERKLSAPRVRMVRDVWRRVR